MLDHKSRLPKIPQIQFCLIIRACARGKKKTKHQPRRPHHAGGGSSESRVLGGAAFYELNPIQHV